MPDKNVTQLTVTTTPLTTGLFYFVQSGADFGMTLATLNANIAPVFANITAKPTTLSGYGITDAQPVDADLTAIAALTTVAFGRSLLTLADASAGRTTLELTSAATGNADGLTSGTVAIARIPTGTSGSTVALGNHTHAFADLTAKPTTLAGYGISDAQPLDSDLTAIAALTTTSFGRGLLAETNADSLKSTLSLNLVDNTSDATKNAASVTLTNKTISGASNTLTVRLANDVTGTLPLGNGGTGQTTAQAAINALMAASGALSQGDTFYFNGTNVVRLPAGTSGHFLKTLGTGANPEWASAAGGSTINLGTKIAWLATTGNDTTGTVGNPALPYLTIQAAYDDGAEVFVIIEGVGTLNAGNLTGFGAKTLVVDSMGDSQIGNITWSGGVLTLVGIGGGYPANGVRVEGNISSSNGLELHYVYFGTGFDITTTTLAAEYCYFSSGGTTITCAGDAVFRYCRLEDAAIVNRGQSTTIFAGSANGGATVDASGVDGADATELGNAVAGNNGGTVVIEYMDGITSVNYGGGAGGNGFDDGMATPDNGAAGGNGGSLTLERAGIGTSTGAGGLGGTAANGGSDGAAGTNGTFNASFSEFDAPDDATEGDVFGNVQDEVFHGEALNQVYVISGGALGTPSSGTLTNATGLPASTGLAGLGTGVATALGENVTGSGALVLAGSPTFTAGITFATSAISTTALATPGALSATQFTAFASTVSGATLMGFGTTNDVSLKNRAGTTVLGVGPNTTTVNIPGALSVAGGISGISSGAIAAVIGGPFAINNTGASGTTTIYGTSGVTFRTAALDPAVTITSATTTLLNALALPKTVTAGGTTGAQTINKATGSVNFAASATSLVVTNSLVSTSSIIHATVATDDATMKSAHVVAGAGSFTLYPDVAPTAETRVNFLVTN